MTDDLKQAMESDDYEIINSEEVDQVVEQLETLIENSASETIRAYLEDTMNSVYYLVYDDEEPGNEAEAA